jgi:hypothetical protein
MRTAAVLSCYHVVAKVRYGDRMQECLVADRFAMHQSAMLGPCALNPRGVQTSSPTPYTHITSASTKQR